MGASRVADAERPAVATPAAIRVRRAQQSDLAEVLSFRLSLLREHPSHPVYGRLHADVDTRARDLFANQLRSDGEAIFLAEVGACAAGIIRCVEMIGSPLLEPARYAYVSSAYVRPEFRRRGVLRAMLRKVERWSQDRGLDQMRLHNVAGSESAEGAWTALGFEVVEQVRLRTIRSD
jgi:ribosomal protein S18 acetylase RimI-like enzyme